MERMEWFIEEIANKELPTNQSSNFTNMYSDAFKVFEEQFPGETQDKFFVNKLLTEMIADVKMTQSFNVIMLNAMESFKPKTNLREHSLQDAWNLFVEEMIPGAEKINLEYDYFKQYPYIWECVVERFIKTPEKAVEIAKQFITAALMKVKTFQELTQNMDVFWVMNQPVVFFKRDGLPYEYCKPDETGAEFSITFNGQTYSIKRLDGENFVPDLCIYCSSWFEQLKDFTDTEYEGIELEKSVFMGADVRLNEIIVKNMYDAVRIVYNWYYKN